MKSRHLLGLLNYSNIYPTSDPALAPNTYLDPFPLPPNIYPFPLPLPLPLIPTHQVWRLWEEVAEELRDRRRSHPHQRGASSSQGQGHGQGQPVSLDDAAR